MRVQADVLVTMNNVEFSINLHQVALLHYYHFSFSRPTSLPTPKLPTIFISARKSKLSNWPFSHGFPEIFFSKLPFVPASFDLKITLSPGRKFIVLGIVMTFELPIRRTLYSPIIRSSLSILVTPRLYSQGISSKSVMYKYIIIYIDVSNHSPTRTSENKLPVL